MTSSNDDPNDVTRSHIQLVKDTLIGHYRNIEKIGAGGMGEVYLAEDTELNRRVALKFLPSHLCRDSDCRARFKREAQAAAKLNHSNIITIHEVSEFDGRPFFAMEHIEGESLADFIKKPNNSLDRIIDLSIQICEGLNKAHQAGIIHRDIKPSNILIDRDGRAKILDFGLAAIKGIDKLTKTGSTLGTLYYMSPEQTRGEELDYRSDIFSLGVVLYEMIASQLPFKGEHEPAIIYSIGYEEPEPLARFKSGVSGELQRIVSKSLSKQRDQRYQHADELLADLKHIASVFGSAPSIRKWRPRIIVPSLALVCLIVVALVLKPWRFEFSPTHETQAGTNWLAVMYFDNISDPADSKRLGEIATNLLITGLSQSEYIRVLSSQRLYDLLKQVGKEGFKTIDRATASEIARKAEAKWMLTGSILQNDPVIVLTSQLVEVASGAVIASQRVTGNPGENIFAVIDRLAEEVRKSNAFPTAIKAEPQVKVADVTTRSPEAYKYFLEGLEYWNKYYNEESRRSMLKALECDSTFTDAYVILAILSSSGHNTKESEEALLKAMKYIDRADERNRLRIAGLQDYVRGDYENAEIVMRDYLERYPDDKQWWFGLAETYITEGWVKNYDSIIACCNRALALDPNYKVIYNIMAYTYDKSGYHKQAIDAINKYIELAPGEANPYDSRGDLYGEAGNLDSAIDSYQKALARKADFWESLKKLGFMKMFIGRYQQAESCFHAYFSNLPPPERGYWRASLTYIPSYQGKFREALRIADDCISANKIDGMESTNWVLYALKSDMYDWLDRPDSALLMVKAALALVDEEAMKAAHLLSWQAILSFKTGDTTAAMLLIGQLKGDAQSRKALAIGEYWDAMGGIALYTKDYVKAIECLTRVDSASSNMDGNYQLAEAYLGSGDQQHAITILEKKLMRYNQDRAIGGAYSVRGYYLLGRAYDESDKREKARATFEAFLTIWKDADPGLKDVEDAKARLARLKAKS